MMLAALPLRILPPQVVMARRPQRMLERMWVVTRAGAWTVVVTGFFEPLFYLLSIRVGFGELIGDVEYAGRMIPYADFVAPALFAASAMNGSIYEATNIFFRLKYDHVYESVLMTPLTSGDVALGEMLYATIRGSLYSIAFLATMWALGMTGSSWAIAMLAVGALISFSFSAIAIAGVTYMRSYSDFEYVPSIMLPMFLFSGTFYPITAYPEPLRIFVQLTPLYQGVDLIRSLTVGDVGPDLFINVAYLTIMGIVGLVIVSRRLDQLLLK